MVKVKDCLTDLERLGIRVPERVLEFDMLLPDDVELEVLARLGIPDEGGIAEDKETGKEYIVCAFFDGRVINNEYFMPPITGYNESQ